MSPDAEDADQVSFADDDSMVSLDSGNVKLKAREKRLFKAALARRSNQTEALAIATAPLVETKAKRTRADDTLAKPQWSSKMPEKTHVESTMPHYSYTTAFIGAVVTVKASILKAVLLHSTPDVSAGFDRCTP